MDLRRSLGVLLFLALVVISCWVSGMNGNEVSVAQSNATSLTLTTVPTGTDHNSVGGGEERNTSSYAKLVKDNIKGSGGGGGGGGSGNGKGGKNPRKRGRPGGGKVSGGGGGGGGGHGGGCGWGCGGEKKSNRLGTGSASNTIDKQKRKEINNGAYKGGEDVRCMGKGRCRGMILDCPLHCGRPCLYDCEHMCRATCPPHPPPIH